MRPQGSPAELERRRRRAVRLLDGGRTLSAVARMVGAAVSAVWQWRETLRRRGPEGLAAKPASGRPRKLTPRQRQRVPRLSVRARARMDFRTICGRPGGSPPSWSRNSASPTTPRTSVASWPTWAGRTRSRSGAPWSATRPRSPAGSGTRGCSLKKSPGPEGVPGLPG